MKQQLLLFLLALLCSQAIQAVPAYPVRKTVRLADGTQVGVTLRGDEHMCYWLADDGRKLRREANGTFRPLSTFELKSMQEAADEERAQSNQRRSRQRRIGTITPQSGQKKGLVILVHFKDDTFSRPDIRDEYQKFFSQKGYSGYGMSGSVSDYFEAQSYGKLTIDFDVVGPYELSQPKAYYGAPSGGSHDTNPRAMIVEACKMADPDVDYIDYDWNHDGKLEQVYVIYSGHGENYTHDADNAAADGNKNIWPHEASIGQELRLDGVYLSTYACSCELRGLDGTQLDGIGTACHEFSHCLGFPDMYDTSGNNFGMGDWDILCSGSYNDDGCTPAGYTSYERWQAGWMDVTELKSETTVNGMKPLCEAGEAYILYNERKRSEYYLLENRQPVGFDKGLPGHGMLVVHVNYDADAWTSNQVNVGSLQRMTILAADENYYYSGTYNDGLYHDFEAGDPFPGKEGKTELTDYSTPAATLANTNTDGVALMHKPIEGIRETADGLISFVACRRPLDVPQVTVNDVQDTQFTATWPAVDRATSYELTLTGIPAKKDPAEARTLEETFAKAYKSSPGTADIGSKLGQYLDNTGFTGEYLYQSPSKLRFGTSTKQGTLRSPVQQALSTTKLTIVATLKPYTEGTSAKGSVSVKTNTQPAEDIPFDISTEQTLVLHPNLTLNEVFRVDIAASSRMYISYLALYDGVFTAQELGLSGNVVEKVRRRVDTKTFTTSETSYTFTELDPSYDYEVSVRALDAISVSLWSEAVKVAARGTGISLPTTDNGQRTTEGVYDLSGRRVENPGKGIYIVNGRKVMR